MKKSDYRAETLATHLGRDPQAYRGVVNVPQFRASTVLFPTLEAYENRPFHSRSAVVYGRRGTPTTFALEDSIAELEGGAGCISLASGLAAITCALLALVEAGDHILVTDSAYEPTRHFCDGLLKRLGVETEYYDPLIGGGIAALLRRNTRLVFTESPGSLTFEMQDIPAIVRAAKAAGALVLMDNSWATPLHYQPLRHGVDVSLMTGTKYLNGHSDIMIGLITSTEDCDTRIRQAVQELGICAGVEETYLALRGLRTLPTRLARHQENGLRLARWLQDRPEVARVLHPALPEDPGHGIWRRDFSGASGLFGFVLNRPYPKPAVAALVDGLELFGIGSSWGGYESLIIAGYPEKTRTATTWDAPGPLLRIHAGLEHPDDLIADLEAGFARLNRAASGG